MVALGKKKNILRIKCISYDVKICKFSFGHEDFHITDYIAKCQLLN